MKALVYTGPERLEFRDAPDPDPRAGDQLVRIDAVGICGSDMHAFLGHDSRRPAPLILGHEAAGTVVGGAWDGRPVTVNPLVSCGQCQACRADRQNLCPDRQIISMPPREGAFAQWLTMPEANLVTVPDGVPLEKAALAEPLAVCWHATKLALAALHPSMESEALVIGGGAIGLASALCLRAQGCENVTLVEPNPLRRTYLQDQCGETVVESWDGETPLVIDAVGYEVTRALASRVALPGGVIAHVGLGQATGGLDIRRMTLQEITFIGTYCYTPQDFQETCAAIFDGRLGALDWTEDRPLSDGQGAFDEIRAGSLAPPKVILKPWP